MLLSALCRNTHTGVFSWAKKRFHGTSQWMEHCLPLFKWTERSVGKPSLSSSHSRLQSSLVFLMKLVPDESVSPDGELCSRSGDFRCGIWGICETIYSSFGFQRWLKRRATGSVLECAWSGILESGDQIHSIVPHLKSLPEKLKKGLDHQNHCLPKLLNAPNQYAQRNRRCSPETLVYSIP